MITDTTDETIRYTADVVLFAAGHVLLIERGWNPFKSRWALPGGHVDTGESSLDASARELEEESGITVPAADLRQVAPSTPSVVTRAAGTSASPTRPPCPRWSNRRPGTTPLPPAGGPWTRSPTSRSTTPRSWRRP